MTKVIFYLILTSGLLTIFLLGFWSRTSRTQLDIKKLDTDFFEGIYLADYNDEVEIVKLKDGGYYDYYYFSKNDTFIINAGKWSFDTIGYHIAHCISLSLQDLPPYRRVDLLDRSDTNFKNVTINFHINYEFKEGFGDLMYTNLDEHDFIFRKLDIEKCNNYILDQ